MVFHDKEMEVIHAHVARDDECASDSREKAIARMEKLLDDLATVATDPVKPKKKETVKAKLQTMRKGPVQLQLRRDWSNANNQSTNSKQSEQRAVQREAYHEELAASVTVQRNSSLICH